MRLKWMKAALPAIALAIAAVPASFGQTDLGVSFFQAFNQSSTGTGVQQTQSNGLGGMIELRHIQKPWIGYEVTYAMHVADQVLAPDPKTCVYDCNLPRESFSAKDHEVGVNWVPSAKLGSLRAFGVGGFGFEITAPGTYPQYILNTTVRIAYVYGGGLDVPLSPRFGLRVQYRGYMYKAPNVEAEFPATGGFVQTAEPMAGVYFHL